MAVGEDEESSSLQDDGGGEEGRGGGSGLGGEIGGKEGTLWQYSERGVSRTSSAVTGVKWILWKKRSQQHIQAQREWRLNN